MAGDDLNTRVPCAYRLSECVRRLIAERLFVDVDQDIKGLLKLSRFVSKQHIEALSLLLSARWPSGARVHSHASGAQDGIQIRENDRTVTRMLLRGVPSRSQARRPLREASRQ